MQYDVLTVKGSYLVPIHTINTYCISHPTELYPGSFNDSVRV